MGVHAGSVLWEAETETELGMQMIIWEENLRGKIIKHRIRQRELLDCHTDLTVTLKPSGKFWSKG